MAGLRWDAVPLCGLGRGAGTVVSALSFSDGCYRRNSNWEGLKMFGTIVQSTLPRWTMVFAIGVLGLALTDVPARAQLLKEIKSRGELVAGTEARYPPFEFVEDTSSKSKAPASAAICA